MASERRRCFYDGRKALEQRKAVASLEALSIGSGDAPVQQSKAFSLYSQPDRPLRLSGPGST